MFDTLEQILIAVFKWRERTALALAEQLAALIERIPEPAKKLLARPKSDRPENYEVIEQAPPGLLD